MASEAPRVSHLSHICHGSQPDVTPLAWVVNSCFHFADVSNLEVPAQENPHGLPRSVPSLSHSVCEMWAHPFLVHTQVPFLQSTEVWRLQPTAQQGSEEIHRIHGKRTHIGFPLAIQLIIPVK